MVNHVKRSLFFFFYRIILVIFCMDEFLVFCTNIAYRSVHFSYINEGLLLKSFQLENKII